MHAQSVVRLRGCPGFWDRGSGMTGRTRGQGITIRSEESVGDSRKGTERLPRNLESLGIVWGRSSWRGNGQSTGTWWN